MNSSILNEKVAASRGAGGCRIRGRLAHRIHLEMIPEEIAVVTFDHPDKSANVFDEETLDELHLAIGAIESLRPRGVVFVSAKPAIFIAGADLDSLADAAEERLEHLIVKGQDVFNRVAGLPMPTAAAIHGACVGGGLELALACDARVASNDRVTKIGLPETQLGILPAWGGSTRLPRLIGLPRALDAILAGKTYSASHARKLGIVDGVVPRERLLEATVRILRQGVPKQKRFFGRNNPLVAGMIRSSAKRRFLARSRGNYPALEEAIDVVTRGGSGSLEKSLLREREAILRLSRTDATRNLMRLFRLQERAKKFRFAPEIDLKTLPSIERTAVIGAGVMGSGIAQWFSAREVPVILRDIDRERVAAGMHSVRKLFEKAVRKRILTRHEAMLRMDLVSPSAEPVPLANCDLVVEAAVEDLEIKKAIFTDLCERTSPETILATNTSALPIGELCTAPGVTHPERIVGLHFFNPVSRMKLVEVVVTDHTAPEVVERVLAFVRGIGKLPVVVKDSPGFLVNRILMPYLIESGHLVDRGYDPAFLDEAMLDFGMPMGPLRLLDEVGLDVAGHVAATMREAFGDRFELPKCLGDHIRDGRLGRKSGRGFYRYTEGTPEEGKGVSAPYGGMKETEVGAYLASLMVREAELCLEEQVGRDADDIDLAMVLGTGFAPFRGGPLAWSRMADVGAVRSRNRKKH